MSGLLNIDSDALVKHTARLERISRSALPVAIRGTLNNAAFDVKKNTMPAKAKQQFIQRKPSFFNATSKVDPAKGFDVSSMKATVGFTGNSQAVEDLEEQEHGGSIGGRSFIPLKQSRVSGNWGKGVRAGNRISAIRGKVIDSKNAKGKNKAEQFTKSAVFAGKGGWVIGNNVKGGNKFLFLIKSLKRVKGDTIVKSVPMFAVKAHRSVKIKQTNFMESASMQSAGKLERFYEEQATKQINKIR